MKRTVSIAIILNDSALVRYCPPMKKTCIAFLMLSSFLVSCSLETETLSTTATTATTTTTSLSPQELELLSWSEAINDILERLVNSNGNLVKSFMNVDYYNDSWVLKVAADLLTLGGIVMPENFFVPDMATTANSILLQAIEIGHLVFREMPSALDQRNSAQVNKNIRRLDDMTVILEKFGQEVSAIVRTLD